LWALAFLAALSVSTNPLLADTILNSGVTTVSTGTDFGTYLFIAQSGTAKLNVTSGGYATNDYGVIGDLVGSSGTAVVFFGGTWASSELLDVGDLGTGKLFVAGGSVTSKDVVLGFGGSGQGTANVSSGSLVISNELHVGYLGAGVLDMSGGSVTSRVGSLGGYAGSTGTATVWAGTWTNSGDLAVGGGGIGTLTMTGGSVKVGGMLTTGPYGTINLNRFGTLQIGLGGTTGVLLGGTGSFDNNGTLAFNRSDASTFSGVISGSGALTKQGAGTLTLSGNNSYTGGTTISDGVLALGSADAVGTSGTISFGGGTLQYSGINTTDYSSRFSTAASQAYEIDTNSQNVTLGSPLSSSGGTLTKFGAGTLTLLGDNSYTGGTTISEGTLQVGVGGTTGSLAGNVINSSALIFSRSDASTYSGDISGAGSLTKQGAGTLTLSGNNSYTGGTTISDGTLQVGAGGTTGSIAGSVLNSAALVFNRSDASAYSGSISGSGALTKQGSGTLTLSGINFYTGGTMISDGVLALGSAFAVGSSGTISFGGGTLQYSASNMTDYSSRFSTAASQAYEIDTNGQNVTLASPLSSSGGTLTKFGAGTLTLSGSNSYTGGTTISAGTLQVGAGGTTGSIAGSVVNDAFLVFNRSNASTYSGVISGTGTIQNGGTGTTTLTGQTSFTNGLAATAGRLIVGSTASVNGFSTAGSLAAASGATLELKSKGLAYVNGLATLTGGTIRAANGISLGAGANVLGTGVISGRLAAVAGSRVEASGGRLTLGDAASYSGIYSDGELYTNANEVELLDRNLAVLGSLTQLGDGSAGGTLRAANGMLLEQGKNLVGRGTVYGNFVNQGDVYGDGSAAGQKIVFAAGSTVSGMGSFVNVVFSGTYSPGNSPAITNLTNGQFSSASSLLIELGGLQPGNQYDRVVDTGVLSLNGGTLNVVLYNGFVPSLWDSFEILQYSQLLGDFGTVNYPALSGRLFWVRTTSATAMTISVVPEPSTYAISAIATAGLASLMRWRKRRMAERTV
jgi:fibronectin-binding autotransporter adhesin